MHCSDTQRVLLDKFPPSLLVITRCEIKYSGKITYSFFLFMSANVISVHLVAHDQRLTGQGQYLIWNYFSNGQ